MRVIRTLAICVVLLVAAILCTTSGRAQVASSVIFGTGGTTFYGIGDLGGGGTNSSVQEVTQVGGIIYAVGASTKTATNTPIATLDTAVVWDSASNTLTPIPDLVSFGTAPTAASSVAYAITPDAQFIAGRVRNTTSNASLSLGIKVPRTSLNTPRTIDALIAVDISDNGNIVFGQQWVDNVVPQNGSVTNFRALRVDVSGPTNTNVQAPLLTTNLAGGCVVAGTTPVPPPPQTCVDSIPANRGMSSDGSVMVGTAFKGTFSGILTTALQQYQTTNGLAFRWVFGQPNVTEIPRPSGGTWSSAIAISPNGNLTVAGGNSSLYPLGEVWIHNATTDTIQEIGSPNTALSPRQWGGMTPDGSVVGVTFGGGSPFQNPAFNNNPIQFAYLHNQFGWFHLANVLTAQGIDLWASGWDPTNMILTGIRTVDTDNNGTPDVDLVFGQGRKHNANGSAGAPEGFAASFPVGVLSSYQLPAATPVANRALVGAWALGPDANNPPSVLVFMTDGTYYSMTPPAAAGYANAAPKFEGGAYTLTAGNAFTLTTKKDRDGSGPSSTLGPPFVFNGLMSSLNGRLSLSISFTSADTFVIEDPTCSPVCSIVQATRIAGGAGSIVGGWLFNDPALFNGRAVIVFLGSSAGYKFFEADDEQAETDNGGNAGTYTWDAGTHQLVETRQIGGLETDTATLTRDELGLVVQEGAATFTLQRIVNPATVLPSITNATLAASGAEDSAFSYTVTAINALTFAATACAPAPLCTSGLPSGLSIDASTGVISGTPAVNGTFNVTIKATNAFGDFDTKTLVLTIAAPPANIRNIGDLTGGATSSAIRDATRVNGVIYAVGAANVNSTSNPPALDTPAFWSSAGGASGTLQALPYGTGVSNTNNTARSAYAITSDGGYVASQAQFANSGTGTRWVRVDRSLLGAADPTTANLDVSNVGGVPVAFAGLSISDNGQVLYGQGTDASGTRTPRRYETGVGINVVDMTPTGKTWGVPIPRGTSSDGLVMVGAATDTFITDTGTSSGPYGYPIFGINTTAFRYVHTTSTLTGTTTIIPPLVSGGWNFPIAMSSDGSVTVVAGNSTAWPSGEIYLTNATNVVLETWGSPNTGLRPRLLGGRSADGAVVVTFANSTLNPGQIGGLGLPADTRLPYVHNSHGWFLLGSVLRAQGIDLEALGWAPTDMVVMGVRTVEGVDLVFGQGRRQTFDANTGAFTNTNQEGFVFELPAGVLNGFDEPTTPLGSNALIGAWMQPFPSASNPGTIPVYLGDGRYVTFTRGVGTFQNGVERGRAFLAGNGGEWYPTVRFDTNATFGQQGFSALRGRSLTVTGDIYQVANSHCNPGSVANGCVGIMNQRVVGSPGTIIGGWTGTIASGEFAGTIVTAVFLDTAQGLRYFIDYDEPSGADEAEFGSYTFNSSLNQLLTTRDNVGGGASSADATLSRDGLALLVEDQGVTFPLRRVVDPATVIPVINSPLTVTGIVGTPFTYTITSTYGLTFDATTLPSWLSLNTITGELTGTPPSGGSESFTIFATNTFGGTGTATLTINILQSQDTLVAHAPANAIYGTTFTATTTGGNGTGAVTFATSGACSNVSGGSLISMTSGSGVCQITATKAADSTYAAATSAPVNVAAQATLTVTWITDASGFWDDAANWSGGAVPGNGDIVVIDRSGANPVVTVRTTTANVHSVTATDEVSIVGGGALTFAAASSFTGGFSLVGGTLTGAGAATFGGPAAWNGGTISLGGGVVVEHGQTLTLGPQDAAHALAATQLHNHGTVLWNNGAIALTGATTVTIINEADGVWDATSDLVAVGSERGRQPGVQQPGAAAEVRGLRHAAIGRLPRLHQYRDDRRRKRVGPHRRGWSGRTPDQQWRVACGGRCDVPAGPRHLGNGVDVHRRRDAAVQRDDHGYRRLDTDPAE